MWQDTVIPLEHSALDGLHCAGVSDSKIVEALETQAEISFGAGYKEGQVDREIESQQAYEAGKDAGRKEGYKEVVDFVHLYFLEGKDKDYCNFNIDSWRAQLKEWGVKK